jgi:hypothetical protein
MISLPVCYLNQGTNLAYNEMPKIQCSTMQFESMPALDLSKISAIPFSEVAKSLFIEMPDDSCLVSIAHLFGEPSEDNEEVVAILQEITRLEKRYPIEDIEAFKAIYKKAPAAKKETDQLAEQIAVEVGGTVITAPLKSAKRALEKKLQSEQKGERVDLKDIVRNTILVEASAMQKTAERLRQAGADVRIVRPDSNPLCFSSIHANYETVAGIITEIQVNTPQMIYANAPKTIAKKILGHLNYKALKRASGIASGMGHYWYELWRQLPTNSSNAGELAKKGCDCYNTFRKLNVATIAKAQ